MTGHPEKVLPSNWDAIPGARGCTLHKHVHFVINMMI